MSKFGKYSSHLQKLYDEQNDLLDEFDELIVSTGCFSCDNFNSKSIKTYAGRFEKCEKCSKYQKMISAANNLDSIEESIDSFIENEYALAVYDYYSRKKPTLLDITGHAVSWNDAFGADFQLMNKESKHYLVGLVENTGKYKLK